MLKLCKGKYVRLLGRATNERQRRSVQGLQFFWPGLPENDDNIMQPRSVDCAYCNAVL